MTKVNGNMPKLPLNGDCVPLGIFVISFTQVLKKRERGDVVPHGGGRKRKRRREGGGVMSVFFSFFQFSLH